MAVNKNRIKFVCASCGRKLPLDGAVSGVRGMEYHAGNPGTAGFCGHSAAGIPSGIIQSQKAFRYSGGK